MLHSKLFFAAWWPLKGPADILVWTRAFHARCYENGAKCSGEKYNRDASSNSKLEQCFRAHSGHEARLGSNFECTVATQHHVAQRSGYTVASGPSIQWLRSIMLHSAVATHRAVAAEQARASILSAQWLRRKLEQWFRPHSADRASSSSDFECTVATEQA